MKIPTKTKAAIKKQKDRLVSGLQVKSEAVRARLDRWKEIAFSEKNNHYFAALSFFPFIGWLLPMYLKRENSFCQDQSKYGFYSALLFTSGALFFIFVGIFFSRDWHVARLINVILIYLIYAVYFAFCIYGINMSIKNRKAEIIDKIPMIDRLKVLIEL